MKFNVIKTGGKQYKVAEGTVITIEKLNDELKKGDAVSFSEVLLTDDGSKTTVGAPFVSGAKVEGEIMVVGRTPKVSVIQYKAKSNYFKHKGHRQPYLKVKITKVA